MSLPKFIVREDSNQEFHFELLRRTLKNISDDEIELFLYYDTEAALENVNDLIEKQPTQKLNRMDLEKKNLALRIKKSANYNLYKTAAKKFMGIKFG